MDPITENQNNDFSKHPGPSYSLDRNSTPTPQFAFFLEKSSPPRHLL